MTAPYHRLPDPLQLAASATGRTESFLSTALAHNASEIANRLRSSRILVTGGAGTIGSETVKLLADFPSSSLHVVDISENYLADLVRDLRNRYNSIQSSDFRTFTMDYGGAPINKLLSHVAPYDYVLNFAAHKHVRGERDGYTLLSMMETNISKLALFKQGCFDNGHGKKAFFSVSTDKAANPSSFMGASKRVMEDVLFDYASLPGSSTSTARFANVAFSNGSLLQAVIKRLTAGEPIAVPEETRRYFVSPSESGELCLLASVLGQDRTIVVPDLDPEKHLVRLQDVAERLLHSLGFRAAFTRDERESVELLGRGEAYPILLTCLDTGGEKPFEEFVATGEVVENWLPGLRAVRRGARNQAHVEDVLQRLTRIDGRNEGELALQIGKVLREAVQNFTPKQSSKHLDQRR